MMTTKAERLRAARLAAGFSSTGAAADRMGVSPSTYRAHENGQNDFNDEQAQLYARTFRVSPAHLMFGIDDPSSVVPASNATVGEKVGPREGVNRIPLYGHAVGGVDGEFVLNGNKLDDILAPPSISHINGAYAVTVAGDSMEPRYEDGETVFVDPKKRVQRGDYVVAQIQFEPGGPPLAYVKRFVRHNADELILEQFNPPKELRFPHDNVVSVHYVALGGKVF